MWLQLEERAPYRVVEMGAGAMDCCSDPSLNGTLVIKGALEQESLNETTAETVDSTWATDSPAWLYM